MTSTYKHAKEELDILFKQTPTATIRDFEDEILALCEKFGQSGQSGGSAPYTALALSEAIKKLCLRETIAPLTGEDSEWSDVSDSKTMYQNKRCSALFKDGKDAKPYYIDAIVKRTPNGSCWSGSFWLSKEDYLSGDNDLKIGTKAYVRSFPFEPKTFYIDVIEEEVKPDDWEMYLKDPKQLEEAFEYYDKIKSKVEMRDDKIEDILN